MKKMVLILALLLSISSTAWAESIPVTSPYGWRIDPITGDFCFHSGVDLGYDYGSEIPALFDGIAVIAGDLNDGYGNQALLYHPQIDAYTRYAHCAALYVSAGQAVSAGKIIGIVGSTGKSTGPHLHLEYIPNTESGYQYANPLLLWQ